MPNGESLAWKLILLGAIIGLGKLLADGEDITLRLAVGRIILGSALALVSGVALIQFGEMHDLALIGIASALGIAGHTVFEALFRKWVNKQGSGK